MNGDLIGCSLSYTSMALSKPLTGPSSGTPSTPSRVGQLQKVCVEWHHPHPRAIIKSTATGVGSPDTAYLSAWPFYCAFRPARMRTMKSKNLRQKMLSLEDAPESSDLMPEEFEALDKAQHIFFKSDPRWQAQYKALKEMLNIREHLPSLQERTEQRKKAARRRGHGPRSTP